MIAMLEEIISLNEKGGPIVTILLILSVAALAMALYKLWHFHRLGIGRHERARAALALWREGGPSPAPIARLEGARGPLALALASAMRGMLHHPEKGDLVREDIDAAAGREIATARRGLRLISTVAEIAPLLGLFGTVLGMIEAFQALQAAGAMVDPSLLAGGIWVALLTTAVGLAIAIPASLVATWFDARLDREIAAIEEMVTAVLTGDLTAARDTLPSFRPARTAAG